MYIQKLTGKCKTKLMKIPKNDVHLAAPSESIKPTLQQVNTKLQLIYTDEKEWASQW